MANENESKAKRINTETELQLLERSFGEWIGELRSSKILSPQQRRVMVWLLTSINIFNAEAAQNTLLTCQYLESSLCPNSSQHCICFIPRGLRTFVQLWRNLFQSGGEQVHVNKNYGKFFIDFLLKQYTQYYLCCLNSFKQNSAWKSGGP